MTERTFTVQASDIGGQGGHYKSSTPRAAAQKAARLLFKESKKSVKTTKFILRETTRGSAKKEFFYEAILEILDEPLVIHRNGVDIKITKKIHVKALTEKQMGHLTHTIPSHHV